MMGAIRHSISRKFTLAMLATTLLALAIMAASLLAYDVSNFRSASANDLRAQAAILARVSAPALEFNDPRVAAENLAQIRARPSILAAALYTPDNHLFAQFATDPSIEIPPSAGPSGTSISGSEITVFEKVSRGSEASGTVFLLARFPLAARIRSYVAILAVVTLGCLLLAAIVSVWLQRSITRPIVSLTEAVGQVVERRDFSTRVEKSTGDEIGVLVDAFNSMLAEVGERSRSLEAINVALTHETRERRDAEDALRLLNSTLEERIAARTAELETAHEQLRQSQKMEAIGQLTGGIAHDFNNLLAGMSGNIEMMRMRIARGQHEDLEKYARSAMTSIGRAAGLTHRLLAFARRQTLDPKPTSVVQLLGSMEDLIQRTVGPGIRVRIQPAADLWNTLCDPNQLESALLNLAINARDAMPDGGTLVFESRNTAAVLAAADAAGRDVRPIDYVTIEVTDSGTGMPPEVLSRVFDPFFTTKPLGQGTGLGLSMIYGFVSQSSGRIDIASTPGQGTTVTIQLPRFDGELAPVADDAGPGSLAPARVSRSILVVDDEAAIRTNLVEMLVDLGYEVLQARDGASAMRVIRSAGRIDLLISDVGLPNGMNGRQLADAARERDPGLKVLFITGYANANVVGNGSMDPGMEVLTKPFTLEAIAARVSAMLHAASRPDADRDALSLPLR